MGTLAKIANVYRTESIGAATRHVFRGIRLRFFPPRDAFDIAHGTRTAGRLHSWEATRHADSVYGNAYDAVSPDIFREASAQIPWEPAQCTFIDLGSGKGRALILAQEAGYRKTVGVEYSDRLIDIARRNLRRANTVATLVCQSAVEYAFPEGNLVVFMFNPFGPEILTQVLRNLSDHSAFVIYINPVHASIFNQFPFLHLQYDRPHVKVWETGQEL